MRGARCWDQSKSVRPISTTSASNSLKTSLAPFIGNGDNVSINIRETHVGRLWGSFTDAALRPWRPAQAQTPAETARPRFPTSWSWRRRSRQPGRRGGKPKPRAIAQRAVSPRRAPITSTSTSTAPAATACRKKQRLRSGAQQSVRRSARPPDTIQHDTIGSAARHQPAGRKCCSFEGRRIRRRWPAMSATTTPTSIPHQRGDAARRAQRLRQHFRHQLHRHHVAGRWRPTCRVPGCARSVSSIKLTRTDLFNNSGSVGVYGSSHGTIAKHRIWRHVRQQLCRGRPGSRQAMSRPRRRARLAVSRRQYYFTGRYLQTTVGIENPTPAYNAIHDFSQRERGFACMSARRPGPLRVSLIAGTSRQQLSDSRCSRCADWTINGCHQRIRRHQFRFSAPQRKPVELTRTLAYCRCEEIRGWLRRAVVLFHALQQFALLAGPGRRSLAQRHRLDRHPHLLHQRYSGRRLLSGQFIPHAARKLRSAASRYSSAIRHWSGHCMICDSTDSDRFVPDH